MVPADEWSANVVLPTTDSEFFVAIRNGDVSRGVDLVRGGGVPATARDHLGRTLLHIAALLHNDQLAAAALDIGASPTAGVVS